MTRSELILRLAQRFPALTPKDIEVAVKDLLDAMQHTLVRGDRVEIRGFGSFGLNYRPPRTARNPKTGVPVEVAGKWIPAFKAGKELRERIAASAPPSTHSARWREDDGGRHLPGQPRLDPRG